MEHLHDLHCHIDLFPDFANVIDESERHGLYTLAVTNTPSVFRACSVLCENKRYVRPALGLHPELAVQRRKELGLFSELLHTARYIGEVGLDYGTNDEENRHCQQFVFGKILEEVAQSGNKVLTVHSRRAARDVTNMIGSKYPGTVILHWYSGPLSVLDAAQSQGFFFSINPSMILSAAGRKVIQQVARDRILLETDGPFAKIDGRAARPMDVKLVIPYLQQTWTMDAAGVHETLRNNLIRALTSSTVPAGGFAGI